MSIETREASRLVRVQRMVAERGSAAAERSSKARRAPNQERCYKYEYFTAARFCAHVARARTSSRALRNTCRGVETEVDGEMAVEAEVGE